MGIRGFIIGLLAGPCLALGASAGEWSGKLSTQFNAFWDEPLHGNQRAVYPAAAFEPEFFHEWEESRWRFKFHPFFRADLYDDERSHADLRELLFEKIADNWELRLGIGQVYWGVTESQHWVDIINQMDQLESFGGGEKLGQLMLNFTWLNDWGILDFFVLPGHRERKAPGMEGRPASPLPIEDRAEYESGAGEWRVDFAARYAHTVGNWDLALSHFHGTSREPRLRPHFGDINLTKVPFYDDILKWIRGGGEGLEENQWGLSLVPYYQRINQTGLELQYTTGGWAWKLEAVHRSGGQETFQAYTGGFEYTLYGAFGSKIDWTIIAEGRHDGRNNRIASLQGDLFLGSRLGFNDRHATTLTGGFLVNFQDSGLIFGLGASRQLRDNLELSAGLRLFAITPKYDLARFFRRDSMFSVELAYFF